MKKVLLISAYFPPMSRIGAKRAFYLSRHLPSYGWQPVILARTAHKEGLDLKLMDLVGEDAIVSRSYHQNKIGELEDASNLGTSTAQVSQKKLKSGIGLFEKLTGLSPQYLLPFDKGITEVLTAIKAGVRLIQEHDIKAIAVSVDPWSSLIVASYLAKKYQLPLIPDFRDPWTMHSGKSKLRPRLTLAMMKVYERKIFKQAKAVILNTDTCAQAYRERDIDFLQRDPFTVIRNAFDPTLFGTWQASKPLIDRPFKLYYFGKFRKFVRPDALFAGLAQLIQEDHLSPQDFQFVMISSMDFFAQQAMEKYKLNDYIVSQPAVSFLESFETLQQADALALVDGGCDRVIAGKIYDYLCAGRPILSVTYSKEVSRIIHESQSGICADPNDPCEIANALRALIDQAKSKPYEPNAKKLASFTADAQAKAYAQVLDQAYLDDQNSADHGLKV